MESVLPRIGTGPCFLAIVLTACQPGPASTSQQIDQNAAIVVGAGEINPVLDPQAEISANGHHYKMAVFDALTYIDAKSELRPALATSWTSVSPTTWEFKLRTNVKFSNGAPFTSKDAVFAFQRILDPATKSLAAGRIATVARAEAPDDLTVRVITKGPDPILTRRAATVFVIDSAAYQKAGADPVGQFVGTGPFKLAEYRQNEKVVLERVETSWRGAPKLAKITMVAMPEVSTRVAALQSGQIDIFQGVPADQIEPLQASGFDIVSGVAARTCALVLNTINGGPLANPTVRQAINYAIDKDAIVKNLWHGVTQPAPGQIVGPDGFGYNPAIRAYPYDPGKAKSLLAQASYANGFSIKFIASKGFFIGDFAVEQALVGMLGAVGINADLDVQEAAAWRANQAAGNQKTMVFSCLNYFPLQDADLPLLLFTSSHSNKWYGNSEFDRLYADSQTTLDSAERLRKLQQIMTILHDDAPAAFLYQEPVIFASSKKIKGIEARPDQVLWFDPITKLR